MAVALEAVRFLRRWVGTIDLADYIKLVSILRTPLPIGCALDEIPAASMHELWGVPELILPEPQHGVTFYGLSVAADSIGGDARRLVAALFHAYCIDLRRRTEFSRMRMVFEGLEKVFRDDPLMLRSAFSAFPYESLEEDGFPQGPQQRFYMIGHRAHDVIDVKVAQFEELELSRAIVNLASNAAWDLLDKGAYTSLAVDFTNCGDSQLLTHSSSFVEPIVARFQEDIDSGKLKPLEVERRRADIIRTRGSVERLDEKHFARVRTFSVWVDRYWFDVPAMADLEKIFVCVGTSRRAIPSSAWRARDRHELANAFDHAPKPLPAYTETTIVNALDYIEGCGAGVTSMLDFKLESVLPRGLQDRVEALLASGRLANVCMDACDGIDCPDGKSVLAATFTPESLGRSRLLRDCPRSATFKMPLRGEDVIFSTPVGDLQEDAVFAEARVEGFVTIDFLRDLVARTTSRLEMRACVIDDGEGSLEFGGQDLVFKLWPVKKKRRGSFLDDRIQATSSGALSRLVAGAPRLRTLTIRVGGNCTDGAAAHTFRTIVDTIDPDRLEKKGIHLFLDDPRGITGLPSLFPKIHRVLGGGGWLSCANLAVFVDKSATSAADLFEMVAVLRVLKGNGLECAFSWSVPLALRAFRMYAK